MKMLVGRTPYRLATAGVSQVFSPASANSAPGKEFFLSGRENDWGEG